jgi:hypothetical protein
LKQANQKYVERPITPVAEVSDSDKDEISSPALLRLIEEVRNEEIPSINAYNRTHNRHNRSR